MNSYPIIKVVRVLNYHCETVNNFISYADFVKWLESLGFSLLEKSSDDFFETFYNPNYKNENRATLIFFNYRLDIVSHQLLIKQPE